MYTYMDVIVHEPCIIIMVFRVVDRDYNILLIYIYMYMLISGADLEMGKEARG